MTTPVRNIASSACAGVKDDYAHLTCLTNVYHTILQAKGFTHPSPSRPTLRSNDSCSCQDSQNILWAPKWDPRFIDGSILVQRSSDYSHMTLPTKTTAIITDVNAGSNATEDKVSSNVLTFLLNKTKVLGTLSIFCTCKWDDSSPFQWNWGLKDEYGMLSDRGIWFKPPDQDADQWMVTYSAENPDDTGRWTQDTHNYVDW